MSFILDGWKCNIIDIGMTHQTHFSEVLSPNHYIQPSKMKDQIYFRWFVITLLRYEFEDLSIFRSSDLSTI